MPARSRNIIQITRDEPGALRLHQGCVQMASRDEVDSLLPHVLAVINRAAIEAARQFAVHASVVGSGESLIAFPSDSGGGKSTLAAAAVMNGFSYLSDEALVLDDDGLVIPYPKPMALSRWSCEMLGLEAPGGSEQLFTPQDLGGKTRTEHGRLTDLVITKYGGSRFDLERRPSSEAVAQLIGKSFNHYLNPERAFKLATRVARGARVWNLSYDEPRRAMAGLAERLTGT